MRRLEVGMIFGRKKLKPPCRQKWDKLFDESS